MLSLSTHTHTHTGGVELAAPCHVEANHKIMHSWPEEEGMGGECHALGAEGRGVDVARTCGTQCDAIHMPEKLLQQTCNTCNTPATHLQHTTVRAAEQVERHPNHPISVGTCNTPSAQQSFRVLTLSRSNSTDECAAGISNVSLLPVADCKTHTHTHTRTHTHTHHLPTHPHARTRSTQQTHTHCSKTLARQRSEVVYDSKHRRGGAGTHFTCFIGIKVQILTQLSGGAPAKASTATAKQQSRKSCLGGSRGSCCRKRRCASRWSCCRGSQACRSPRPRRCSESLRPP